MNEMPNSDELPRRKEMNHVPPPWIRPGHLFFLTVGCQPRGPNVLCRPEIAPRLLDAARLYHDRRKWFLELFLLMPDHWHALVAFADERAIVATVRNWKRYTSRMFGVCWQRDFFEHRLRNEEEESRKWYYIMANPARKGLIAKGKKWPWVIQGK
ncbi:transposase, partial [Candidatus Sumerlaeota bacterium]